VLQLSDERKWQKYISRLPSDKQDVYYTPEYYRLYHDLKDGKARCFVYHEQGDLALYPFLINPVNISVFDLNRKYYDIQGAYGYNGVVSTSETQSFIQGFYCSFNNFCSDNSIIAEFTRFHPLLNNKRFSEGDRKSTRLNSSHT